MNDEPSLDQLVEFYHDKYWMFVIHIPTACFYPIGHGVTLWEVQNNMFDIYGANVQLVDFYMNDNAADAIKWLMELRRDKLQEVEKLKAKSARKK